MSERIPAYQLDAQGIASGATIHWNLTTAPLVEQAVARGEGKLTRHGALLVDTGKFTGRSVKDKFIVRDAETESTINWGPIDQPCSSSPISVRLASADSVVLPVPLRPKKIALLPSAPILAEQCIGITPCAGSR